MEEKLLSGFKELELAGKGTISVVYKGNYQSSNKTYAIKYLKAQTKDLYDLFLRELGIQRGISHPNIMPIYMYDHDNNSLEALYTMPFLRSLRAIMDSNTNRPHLTQVIQLLRDISNALDHVKRFESMAHGKIKPENIFFSERTNAYQLADWSGHYSFRINNSSIMRRPEGSRASTVRRKHTPNSIYEAPEAQMSLDASTKDKLCSYKADVYALGITMLEFCGFEREKLLALNSAASDAEFKTVHQTIAAELASWYSNEKLTDILIRMTNRRSYQRPSAFEIFLHVEGIGRKDDEKNEFQGSFIEINLGKIEKTLSKIEPKIVSLGRVETVTENLDESRPSVDLSQLKPSIEGKYSWTVQGGEEGQIEGELINNSKIKKAKIFDRENSDEHIRGKVEKSFPDVDFKLVRSKTTKEDTNETPAFKSTKTGETMVTMNDWLKLEGNNDSHEFDDEVEEEKDEEMGSRYKKLQETQLKPTNKQGRNKLEMPEQGKEPNRGISKFKTFIGTFGAGLSNLGTSINDFGANLSEFGKKALDFGENNLNSINEYGKKALNSIERIGIFTTKKENDEFKKETSMFSPRTEGVLSPSKPRIVIVLIMISKANSD